MLIAATSPLLFLAFLACPVGMGVMMLFMARGMKGGDKHEGKQAQDRGSLAEMKAEQARLAEKIETLEGRQSQASRTEERERSEAAPTGER